MNTLLVNGAGVVLIGLIAWWFWLYGRQRYTQPSNGIIHIVVESGIYKPAFLQVPLNKPTTLRFMRKDSSPCSATVIFDGLGISKELPENKTKDVVITPSSTGYIEFACPMKMYRGKIEVK